MPIIGGTIRLGTNTLARTTCTSMVSYDTSGHSDDPTFTTFIDDGSSSANINAPLCTAYCTSSTKCTERWMSVGSQLVAVVHTVPTAQVGLSRSGTSSTTIMATANAIRSVVAPLILDRSTFETTNSITTPSAKLLPQGGSFTQGYMPDSLNLKRIDTVASTWQKEDLESLPSDWKVSLVKKIGAVLPANTEGASRQGSTGGSGLSTGTKASIGVGVTIGILFVAMTFVLLYLRRRRKMKSQPDTQEHSMSEDTRSGSRPHQEELVDWREVVEGGRLPN